MTIEIYRSKKWNSITAVVEGDKEMLEDDAVLIRRIEGADWNDCMAKHHELMGWEPYMPFIP